MLCAVTEACSSRDRHSILVSPRCFLSIYKLFPLFADQSLAFAVMPWVKIHFPFPFFWPLCSSGYHMFKGVQFGGFSNSWVVVIFSVLLLKILLFSIIITCIRCTTSISAHSYETVAHLQPLLLFTLILRPVICNSITYPPPTFTLLCLITLTCLRRLNPPVWLSLCLIILCTRDL